MKTLREIIGLVEEKAKDPYTTKSGKDVDDHVEEHEGQNKAPSLTRKPDHIINHPNFELHVHHMKGKDGKTTHTHIRQSGGWGDNGEFTMKGKAHPKHIESSWKRAFKDEED